MSGALFNNGRGRREARVGSVTQVEGGGRSGTGCRGRGESEEGRIGVRAPINSAAEMVKT